MHTALTSWELIFCLFSQRGFARQKTFRLDFITPLRYNIGWTLVSRISFLLATLVLVVPAYTNAMTTFLFALQKTSIIPWLGTFDRIHCQSVSDSGNNRASNNTAHISAYLQTFVATSSHQTEVSATCNVQHNIFSARCFWQTMNKACLCLVHIVCSTLTRQ